MKRMARPNYSYRLVAEKLRDSMDPNPRLNKLRPLIVTCLDSNTWINAENVYTTAANIGLLNTLKKCDRGTKESPGRVLGGFTGEEMIRLYEDYLSNPKKPELRAIYDNIRNSAEEECPYCAGLSSDVDTLDHYLPKSSYPRFSVLPANLIPACSACNKKMLASSSAFEGEQFIHPYSDHSRFFDNQWLFAEYSLDRAEVTFFVKPPTDWSETDKARVNYHFKELNLGDRLRRRAERELAGGMKQFQKARLRSSGLTLEEAAEDVFSCWIDVEFLNHWKRVAFLALKEAVLKA